MAFTRDKTGNLTTLTKANLNVVGGEFASLPAGFAAMAAGDILYGIQKTVHLELEFLQKSLELAKTEAEHLGRHAESGKMKHYADFLLRGGAYFG